jgi:hypothetical protein
MPAQAEGYATRESRTHVHHELLKSGPSQDGNRSLPCSLHPTPGGNDHVWVALDDLFRGRDALFCLASEAEFRKDGFPTSNLDQFFDPLDTADERIIPFLEKHTRSAREGSGRVGNGLQLCLAGREQLVSFLLLIHEAGNQGEAQSGMRLVDVLLLLGSCPINRSALLTTNAVTDERKCDREW